MLSDFQCNKCSHTWEDFHNAYNPEPTQCEKCQDTNISKIISFTKSKGVVELTGHELTQKTKDDIRAMKSRARTDENYRANVVGESAYNKSGR